MDKTTKMFWMQIMSRRRLNKDGKIYYQMTPNYNYISFHSLTKFHVLSPQDVYRESLQ